MKAASFFAGIGGFDLGLERAGIPVVFQCEINSFCQSVLRKHWPDVPLFSDINLVKSNDIPKEADVWAGGFPCQDLSLANQGKRQGLEGARSGLFYKYAELVEARRPRWVIVENVPGLLNSHNGKDFECVVNTLDELGYGVSWRVFDAKYFGTPQRRRRVYVVASFGDLSSEEVLFERTPPPLFADAGSRAEQTTAGSGTNGNRGSDIYLFQHAGIGRKSSAGPQAKGYRNDGEAYTLDSRGSADAICSTAHALRMREATGISGELDSHRYRAIGNAVCVPIAQWIARRILQHEAKKRERVVPSSNSECDVVTRKVEVALSE